MRILPFVRSTVAALALALGSAALPSATAAALGGSPLAQAAIPVQQVLDPVGFVLCTPDGPGATEKCEAFGNPPAYQVPSGRRLIIEQVSGSCGHDKEPAPFRVQIVAQTKGAVLEHAIIGVIRPDAPGGLVPLTTTRIYADPNSAVTLDITEVPSQNGRFCRLTFSGQLVKP